MKSPQPLRILASRTGRTYPARRTLGRTRWAFNGVWAIACATTIACGTAITGVGCQTLGQSPETRWAAAHGGDAPAAVRQVAGEGPPLTAAGGEDVPASQTASPAPTQPTPSPTQPPATPDNASGLIPPAVTKWIPGRKVNDPEQSKVWYREGDALFRQASQMPRGEAQKTFQAAAKKFRQAADAAPDSALGQDALFMLAESQFFADRLTDAVDSYQKLQKNYPRNRHSDRAAARLFGISRYWIETEKATGGRWLPNFTDAKRPRFDTDGHAIRVLDQIRFDDPTGRLADDATMAAAAEYIRQQKFDLADEFLTDLRESYPDSEHLFLAHLLGIQCKLERYAGPRYSNLLLDEADKLVEQTRRRFPDRMREPKYAEIVARAAARISFHQAEKLYTRAKYRDKRHEYRAAAQYYQTLLDRHSDTPFADDARKRLVEIADRPAVPERYLSFLTMIFQDGRRKTPLEFNGPDAGEESGEETFLR